MDSLYNDNIKYLLKFCDGLSSTMLYFASQNFRQNIDRNKLISKYDLCEIASSAGHLNILKWARANNYSWDNMTCNSAAFNGHLEILKWAHTNGCEWDSMTCSKAAFCGHLEVLQWARENGCKWDSFTCTSAALNGHLEVLKWARANGCEWNCNTCSNAAYGGHLEVLEIKILQCSIFILVHESNKLLCNLLSRVLKWARAKGCEWDSETCHNAAHEGHLEVLEIKMLHCSIFILVHERVINCFAIYYLEYSNGPEKMVVNGMKKLKN